jgi:hypothetical protein
MARSATFSAHPDTAALLAQAERETGLHDFGNEQFPPDPLHVGDLAGLAPGGQEVVRPGRYPAAGEGIVYGPEEAGPEGCFMLNIFADRRGFYPTLLGEPAQDHPAVEPHILLSKVWNALAQKAEPGTAPISGG